MLASLTAWHRRAGWLGWPSCSPRSAWN